MQVYDEIRAKVVADPNGIKKLMLTPTEVVVLQLVRILGPLVASFEMSDQLGLTQRDTNNRLLALVNKGYLERYWYVHPSTGGYYRYTSRFA